jgi:hypothetical protein
MQIGGIAARGLLLPVLVSAALRGGAEFDVAASRVLVTYAWASFCEPATLTNWSCEWCDTASLAASLLARVDFLFACSREAPHPSFCLRRACSNEGATLALGPVSIHTLT